MRRVRQPGPAAGPAAGRPAGALARGAPADEAGQADQPALDRGRQGRLGTPAGRAASGDGEPASRKQPLSAKAGADQPLFSLRRQGQARARGVTSWPAIGRVGSCDSASPSVALRSLIAGSCGRVAAQDAGPGAGQVGRAVSARPAGATSPRGPLEMMTPETDKAIKIGPGLAGPQPERRRLVRQRHLPRQHRRHQPGRPGLHGLRLEPGPRSLRRADRQGAGLRDGQHVAVGLHRGGRARRRTGRCTRTASARCSWPRPTG